MIVWPSELPLPTRDGHAGTWQESRLRRAADGGPPGWRRRFSSAARNVSLVVVLDRAQRQIFDAFWELDTRHGSRPFTMPDPLTEGWPLLDGDGAPMLTGDGEPILLAATWLCLFGDEPPSERISRALEFDVSFSVWVMP